MKLNLYFPLRDNSAEIHARVDWQKQVVIFREGGNTYEVALWVVAEEAGVEGPPARNTIGLADLEKLD